MKYDSSLEKNAGKALEVLFTLLNVRITKSSLKEKLITHPDFPSLSALSDVLNDFKINNLAVRLTADNFTELPFPVLIYLKVDGGIFAPISKIDEQNDEVEWFNTKKGWQKSKIDYFLQYWEGIAILPEVSSLSGEINFNSKRQKEVVATLRYPTIVLGIGLIISCAFGLVSTLNSTLFFDKWLFSLCSVTFIGTIISIFLVWYSLDGENPFLRTICKLNDKTNCQNILNSSAAKIFSWLSWSEVGLFYFSGSFIAILLSFLFNVTSPIKILLILNIMVLPYTIYSIYYQAFVAKKWCVLCTIIQLILWLEFFIGLNIGLEFRWEDLLKTANIMIMSFVFAPTIWALSKKTIEKSLKTDKLLIDNQKMIFDSDFIEVLLKRQKIMPPIFADMNLITIGRSDSKNIITLVMNPVCKKCGEAFNQIEKLLNDNNEFRCQMIFIATNFSDDEAGEFVRKLMSLSDGKKISALKGWFNLEHKSIKKWSKYFEANIETEDSIKQLDLQYKWCELANTRTSPILFLNSLEIPKMYNVNDLEKLIKFIHPVNQNLYYG